MKKIILDLKDIFGIFVAWRFSLLLFSFFSLYLLGGFLTTQRISFLGALSYWDGGHYIGIAKNGYQALEQYAFFPLYPLLIKTFGPIFLNNFNLAALFISSFFTFFGLVFFKKLGEIDFNKKEVQKSMLFFLMFPTAFFLVAAYSEALFIFLSLSSFYFSRKGKWILSSILASLAAATKPFGILLFIALVYEYLKQRGFKIKRIGYEMIYLFISSLGLLIYMTFLKLKTGSALFFITSQSNWQREFITFSPKVFFEKYFSVFSLNQIGTRFFAQQTLELFSVIFFIAILIYSLGKLRSTYIFYCFLLLLLALSTGVLTSFPRFFLLAFPLFFTFPSLCQNRLFEKFLFLNFVLFQGLFLTLFLTGIWVA